MPTKQLCDGTDNAVPTIVASAQRSNSCFQLVSVNSPWQTEAFPFSRGKKNGLDVSNICLPNESNIHMSKHCLCRAPGWKPNHQSIMTNFVVLALSVYKKGYGHLFSHILWSIVSQLTVYHRSWNSLQFCACVVWLWPMINNNCLTVGLTPAAQWLIMVGRPPTLATGHQTSPTEGSFLTFWLEYRLVSYWYPLAW